MPSPPTQMAEHYGLVPLLSALNNYQPPTGPFDPAGSWTSTYRIFTLTLGARNAGTLAITRTPSAGGGATLAIDMRRLGVSNATQRILAEIEIAGDELSTPTGWTLEARLANAGGATIPGTAMSQAGSVAAGVMTTTVAGVPRQKPVGPHWANNWGLFDAVQRLDFASFAGRDFTLLHHFDQAKPNHRLVAAEAADIVLGGVPATEFETIELEKGTLRRPFQTRSGGVEASMVCYHQRGEGTMPTIYWATASGRLLFMTAGIEGYMLIPEQSTP